jgi:5-methylcytosine-specific restriction enzyme subunit McrC
VNGTVVSGETRIPVRNLWLLMLYASKLFATNATRFAGAEARPDDLPDLVAEVLADAVERRLRRGLGRAYIARHESLTRVRGRIDPLHTTTHQLMDRGLVSCRYTELHVDNARNRLLLAALSAGGAIVKDPTLAHRCRRLVGTMRQFGVKLVPISPADADTITVGRNDVADVDAVNAARLLLRMRIPNEDNGSRHRYTPYRDIEVLRKLYEAAVRGFYRVALPRPWRVHPGETVHHWPVDQCSAGAFAILPTMRTDTIIESPDRRIVVETKFTDALKLNPFGPERISRHHLFQIYAYVQSQTTRDELAGTSEGVLLYPTIRRHVDEFIVVQGHRYRFLTVDLAGETSAIREQLLSVVASTPG